MARRSGRRGHPPGLRRPRLRRRRLGARGRARALALGARLRRLGRTSALPDQVRPRPVPPAPAAARGWCWTASSTSPTSGSTAPTWATPRATSSPTRSRSPTRCPRTGDHVLAVEVGVRAPAGAHPKAQPDRRLPALGLRSTRTGTPADCGAPSGSRRRGRSASVTSPSPARRRPRTTRWFGSPRPSTRPSRRPSSWRPRSVRPTTCSCSRWPPAATGCRGRSWSPNPPCGGPGRSGRRTWSTCGSRCG